jgi:hypothetical protein
MNKYCKLNTILIKKCNSKYKDTVYFGLLGYEYDIHGRTNDKIYCVSKNEQEIIKKINEFYCDELKIHHANLIFYKTINTNPYIITVQTLTNNSDDFVFLLNNNKKQYKYCQLETEIKIFDYDGIVDLRDAYINHVIQSPNIYSLIFNNIYHVRYMNSMENIEIFLKSQNTKFIKNICDEQNIDIKWYNSKNALVNKILKMLKI